MQKKALLCLLLVPTISSPVNMTDLWNYKPIKDGCEEAIKKMVSSSLYLPVAIVGVVFYSKYVYNKDSNDKRVRIAEENNSRLAIIQHLEKQITGATNQQSPKKLIRNIKYLDKEIARLGNIQNRTDEEQKELTEKIATRKTLDRMFMNSQSPASNEQNQQDLQAKAELIQKLEKALMGSQYNNLKSSKATPDGFIYENAKSLIGANI